MRDGVKVTYWAHNPDDMGSTPIPATVLSPTRLYQKWTKMRNEREIMSAMRQVERALNREEYEDNPELQAIHDTLRFVFGLADYTATIDQYMPLD